MSEKTSGNPIGKALIVLLIVGGGWLFLRKYEIHGLDHVQVMPRTASSADAAHAEDARMDAYLGNGGVWTDPATLPGAATSAIPSSLVSARIPATAAAGGITTGLAVAAPTGDGATVRVASWAMAGLGRDKVAKPAVMDLFSRIVRQFDVIALQQITSTERDLLPRVLEHVNRTGRRYDFLLGPRVAPHDDPAQVLGEQYAFLFDTERVETDRGQLYTVADPGEQVSYDPLVGWFRVRTVSPDQAWTFTLVNFRVDSSRSEHEVPLVANIMAAVAADGRGEDDLLLAGMLQADDRQLARYLGVDTSQPVVRATPTDIFARHQLSNLISPKETTTEYLGRGGVVDFLRIYNLSAAECEELTPHLPVYGEFTSTEGH